MNLCSTGHANRRRSPTAQRVQESISYLWSFSSCFRSFVVVVVCRHRSMTLYYFHQPYFHSHFLPIKFLPKIRKEKKKKIHLLSLSLSSLLFLSSLIFVSFLDDKYMFVDDNHSLTNIFRDILSFPPTHTHTHIRFH